VWATHLDGVAQGRCQLLGRQWRVYTHPPAAVLMLQRPVYTAANRQSMAPITCLTLTLPALVLSTGSVIKAALLPQ
jgi:hypothetical protein